MTDQHAKAKIKVNLVLICHSKSHTPNTSVSHDKICANIKAAQKKDDRQVLQCLEQGRGIFGFWISPVCFLRWVIYNHYGVDHRCLAYSEDSTECFTPSELEVLHNCINDVHPNIKCTLLV